MGVPIVSCGDNRRVGGLGQFTSGQLLAYGSTGTLMTTEPIVTWKTISLRRAELPS